MPLEDYLSELGGALTSVSFSKALQILVPVRQGLAVNAQIDLERVDCLRECAAYLRRTADSWSNELRLAAPEDFALARTASARTEEIALSCEESIGSRFENHSESIGELVGALVSATQRPQAIEGFERVEAAAARGDSQALEAMALIRPSVEVITSPPISKVGGTSRQVDTPESIEDVLGDLDELVGLAEVKADVRRLIAFLSLQEKRETAGLSRLGTAHHLVFVGPPGTGKTTVARIYGRLLRSLGVLSTGNVVEASREDLVAEYVGQTAVKTSALLDSAVGGVLFIDEAYSLAPANAGVDFGNEAIEVLLKRMEDQRDELAVIVAGYPQEMDRFISSNPGLESRFTNRIAFPSYSEDELVTVFVSMLEADGMKADEGALNRARKIFSSALETQAESFGNARFARKLCETAYRNQAARLMPIAHPTVSELTMIKAEDIVYDA